jgi:hypothetical protein
MYSRVTLVEIDTLRTSVDAAAQLYSAEVLPRLRAQDGYEGSLVLATPEGKGVIVTLWSTEEAAVASAALSSDILAENVALFRAPPGREHYRVAVADLPDLALGPT